MSPVFAIEESAAQRVIETLKGLDYASAFERAERETAFFNESRSEGKKPYQVSGTTAVIPLTGPMSKHYTCATWLIGGTASTEVAYAIRQATKDDSIETILMVIDSPGGEVSGIEDLGNALFAARGIKKTVAVIEDMACSAGYWVASQAEEVWCNRTAWVGNIGVYTVVHDFSKAAAEQGVKVTVVKSAERKGDGVRGAKVEKAAYDHLQELIDTQHANFVAAVARGRGMTTEDVEELADGRCHIGQDAVDAGLADRIGSVEDALTSLQPKGGSYPHGVAAAETLENTSMAEPQEPKGFMDHMKAFFTGQPASQAAEGGGGGHDNEPSGDTAALQATIDRMNAENAERMKAEMETKADAFVKSAFEAGKIKPTEQAEAKQLYLTAYKADGMKEGDNTKALVNAYENREPAAQVQSQIPANAKVTDGDFKQSDEDARAAWFGLTPLGKQVMEASKN